MLPVKIIEELKGHIQHLAEMRQRSAHWIMLEAICAYVEPEENRGSCKQEALASWKAYREIGHHLTGKETRSWLATWGTDQQSKQPVYHM